MSSARVQKMFTGLTEQLRKLGPYANAFKSGIVAQGRDSAGRDAVLIDLTGPTWATGNLRVIIAAVAAADYTNSDQFKTQSHVANHFIDGSVSFEVRMETPATHTDAHAKFQREILHALRGQLGAPVELLLTANATQPTLQGLDGAAATAATVSAGVYNPYFFALPGGV